ncbi:S8 family peptidase [Qipengyuania spongiae]|uniref:S8 family serine peptidase n=1 Tax=Qipengyuania spongiae TaxID=2909673 RepID=A0ABY5T1F5_9SPHN|nr:S8 family peptidase [Qipengyuania spongiae]UVI40597.1 S8 family serine peptidase [Qipengyuania spongiae]
MNFRTPEFDRSDGPDQHGAISAWQRGATGNGVTIAVVDTGIDTASPEFAGRIHPNSRDVAGNRGIQQEDDHGTNVALVAAAARNNSGILGMAFDASVLVLRADRVGTCGTDTPEDTSLGCSFLDTDIATAIDVAISSQARVVNLSLGGARASRAMLDAVRRASQAGVVVVVAAGNGGEGDVADTDPNQPTGFASALRAAGGDNVIIVGSVNEGGTISGFSQRAGNEADWYLGARGERVCCVYENGQIFVGQDQDGSFRLLFSGTSFAAPQVAGAVALLAQAFPNLTGQQIVEILLSSARDAGDAGTDTTYGRGILDIASAFAPVGATTMAGGTAVVRVGVDSAVASAAMGDAFAGGQNLRGIVLDKYARAYEYDFGSRLRGAIPQYRLHAVLDSASRHVSAGNGETSLAFTIADPGSRPRDGWINQLRLSPEQAESARVLAARLALRIDPRTQIGLAMREGATGLVGQLQESSRPAFLIAGQANGDTGFERVSAMSLALRREVGAGVGLTLSAESGDAWLGNLHRGAAMARRERERFATRSFAVSADRAFGPLETVLGLTWLQEDRTVLGGYFDDSLGASGADNLFLDAGAAMDVAGEWTFGANVRQGYTRAHRGGLVAAGSNFASNAWSFDLSRRDTLRSGDSFGFRIAQPLRVTGGGINFAMPVSYDYATTSAGFGLRHLSLAPTGREVTGEMAWRGPLWWGEASASLFYRRQPGHYAAAPDDTGVALSWRRGF